MKNYLNLGCGQRYAATWTNIDFVSKSPHVRAHNLLEGIPFDDETFDVVYHSHVLEHFTPADGKAFLEECRRVLKKGGILRIAVPDLEQIGRAYLQCLDEAIANPESREAAANYKWIVMELIDQMVRQQTGGQVQAYLSEESVANLDFVYRRVGAEAQNLREYALKKQAPTLANALKTPIKTVIKKQQTFAQRLRAAWRILGGKPVELEESLDSELRRYCQVGHFRLSGEVHQWMYDRYSLPALLQSLGFVDIQTPTAFESRIPDWQSFELEARAGQIHKPDSLFVEALKP
jgi:predicted SAM-dependent methyltransferase